jgi:hypothetical protein
VYTDLRRDITLARAGGSLHSLCSLLDRKLSALAWKGSSRHEHADVEMSRESVR